MKMRVSVILLLVLSVWSGSLGVHVKDGDRSFPLEAVQKLKELMDLDARISPHVAGTGVGVVCSDPALPDVFLPVCQESGTAVVFSRLARIITPSDPCEICANPSCYGCLN